MLKYLNGHNNSQNDNNDNNDTDNNDNDNNDNNADEETNNTSNTENKPSSNINENTTKSNNKNDDDDDKNKPKNNWNGFLKGILNNFIIAFILALLGANFVFLTRLSKEDKDMIFPTDEGKSPYKNKEKNIKDKAVEMVKKGKETLKKGFNSFKDSIKKSTNSVKDSIKKSNNNEVLPTPEPQTGGGKCDINNIDKSSPVWNNEYFQKLFAYGFPYNMESNNDTIMAFFSNWFSKKVKKSNIWLRTVISTFIDVSESLCGSGKYSELIQFILGPFVIFTITSIVSSIWWLATVIAMFISEDAGLWGYVFTICGLFFGWSWFFAIGLSFVQIFSVMFRMILLPLMLNGGKVWQLMKYNWDYIGLIVMILTLQSSFTHLDNPISYGILFIFLYNIYSMFKKRGDHK